MRSIWVTALLAASIRLQAQDLSLPLSWAPPPPVPGQIAMLEEDPGGFASRFPQGDFSAPGTDLPDAPSAVLQSQTAVPANPTPDRPCEEGQIVDTAALTPEARCAEPLNPYARFLNSPAPLPLSPRQKGFLAIHDIIDPFNLLTIVGNSAFTIGIDAHTAYGPGMRGFGKNVGVSFLQDATGEFVGTFAIASLVHEDPHYHRMPNAPTLRRVLHAVSRTIIAQHDDGSPMPNYEVLLTYPISAVISNLYVPGIHGNGPSTAKRVLTGLATDPIGNVITEFLPDLSRHVHINIIFVQQILNQISSGQQM